MPTSTLREDERSQRWYDGLIAPLRRYSRRQRYWRLALAAPFGLSLGYGSKDLWWVYYQDVPGHT